MNIHSVIHTHFYKTPYGELILGSYTGKLCLCDWRYRKMRHQIDNRLSKYFDAVFVEHEDDLIKKAIGQLSSYFDKQTTNFNLPLLFSGSSFQISVWQMLQEIPYGETITYQDLANRLSKPKAVRAVAAANGANAHAIIIPCHRVIGQHKQLTGYAGGLTAKRKLLSLEGAGLLPEQQTLFS